MGEKKRTLTEKWAGSKITNFVDWSQKERDEYNSLMFLEPFTSKDAERVRKEKEKTKKVTKKKTKKVAKTKATKKKVTKKVTNGDENENK